MDFSTIFLILFATFTTIGWLLESNDKEKRLAEQRDRIYQMDKHVDRWKESYDNIRIEYRRVIDKFFIADKGTK